MLPGCIKPEIKNWITSGEQVMLLILKVNALLLRDFKNAADSRVVSPKLGLPVQLMLSLGIPQPLSLPSLTDIIGCLLLSPSYTRGSVEGGCLCFQCLYSPYSDEDWLVLEKEPFPQNKSENEDKYSGNILEASSLHWICCNQPTAEHRNTSGTFSQQWHSRCFFLRRAKGRVALLHRHWQRLSGSDRQERDSYEVLRGRDSPWPGPWLWSDPRGVWGRGDAQGTFDPALVPEWALSSTATLPLMPTAWCFPQAGSHYTPDLHLCVSILITPLHIHPLSAKWKVMCAQSHSKLQRSLINQNI